MFLNISLVFILVLSSMLVGFYIGVAFTSNFVKKMMIENKKTLKLLEKAIKDYQELCEKYILSLERSNKFVDIIKELVGYKK